MKAQDLINEVEREDNLKGNWDKDKFKLQFYDNEFKKADRNITKVLGELK